MSNTQVAVITGGGRGIGRAIAEAYAQQGFTTVLWSRSQTELEETAQSIRAAGGKADFQSVDVSDEAAVQKAADLVLERYGKVDILVNAAAIIGPIGPLHTVDTKEWNRTFQINVNGTLFPIKSILPNMIKNNSGRIINFSGGGALLPSPYFDAYSLTKAAIVRLTENLSLELKDKNIMVCAIAPGGVNTRMFDDMMAPGQDVVSKEIWESFMKRKDAGGDSMDSVVGLLSFLAKTPSIAAITGRVISAKWDKWKSFDELSKEFADTDVYTMRRIMPQDRKLDW